MSEHRDPTSTQDGILDDIDRDVADRLSSRREAVRALGRDGARALALGSVPVALAASASSAFGRSGRLPEKIVRVLNFALTLELLESGLYDRALRQDGLIPAADRPIFAQIAKHERDHVSYLQKTLGSRATKRPAFDYTGAGEYAPFESYRDFTRLSQALEDTGVRAYKGQTAKLVGNKDVLTAALTIHSVEARHAAIVRRLNGFDGWIPTTQPGVTKKVAPVYAGMDETRILDIDVPRVSGVDAKQVGEAFDEPLSQAQVLSILVPFLKGATRS